MLHGQTFWSVYLYFFTCVQAEYMTFLLHGGQTGLKASNAGIFICMISKQAIAILHCMPHALCCLGLQSCKASGQRQ